MRKAFIGGTQGLAPNLFDIFITKLGNYGVNVITNHDKNTQYSCLGADSGQIELNSPHPQNGMVSF